AIIGMAPDGRVTSWNHAAARLLGYPADAILGQPIEKIIPAGLLEAERGKLARIACGEHVDHYETVRTANDGREIPVSVRLSPILDRAGSIIGISKIARDITERKLVEEA